MKYRRVVVSRHGGPEVLQVIEEDIPEPKAGEVRVKVLAAGVSAYDLMFRRSGRLPGTPRVPFTPGEDVVGIVEELGAGVTAFQPGQMVAGGTFSLGVGGGYAEYVSMAAGEWVPVPSELDPVRAVCLVVNYVTAHVMLHRAAQVREGDRILVHGAAGGVGSALLDLGRQVGLEMFGTASKHNHHLVSAFGATPIDYRADDFVACVRQLTGDGVDAVFDPIGGARQLWRSYRALRRGGRLVWFGVAATRSHGLRIIPSTLLMRALLKILPDGRKVPSTPNAGKHVSETLAELIAQLASGKIDPVVAARIPLAEAARAHELLERGGVAGKIVLTAND
ncbi:MAG: zinc-binding dehydrogenase [Candidatus Bipolaricaulota bacterium]|nr:MAG: zinc-binding dehydrogenase [Candidatus Bipolaricaulota bacterium]